MKYILIAVLLASTVALAAPDEAATRDEIKHLLAYVGGSDVVFVRNGKDHTAKEAVEHMEKKRDYFIDKGKIATAEDFIAYAGTKSLLSGKLYQVRLKGGETKPCGAWLLAELKRYRLERPGLRDTGLADPNV